MKHATIHIRQQLPQIKKHSVGWTCMRAKKIARKEAGVWINYCWSGGKCFENNQCNQCKPWHNVRKYACKYVNNIGTNTDDIGPLSGESYTDCYDRSYGWYISCASWSIGWLASHCQNWYQVRLEACKSGQEPRFDWRMKMAWSEKERYRLHKRPCRISKIIFL